MIKSVLIAGPWIGEFGWELMAFQARIRALSRYFEKVIVIGSKEKEKLYEDFALYYSVKLPDNIGFANGTFRYKLNNKQKRGLIKWCQDKIKEAIKYISERYIVKNLGIYIPFKYGELPWIPTYPPYQKFIRFGTSQTNSETPLVLFVRRNRSFMKEINLPEEWWHNLKYKLDKYGIKCSFFKNNLDEGLKQLSSSDLAIGASTGGLHLASLCGCPHYVWGPGSEKIMAGGPWPIPTEVRYNATWNPLGTPVFYRSLGWQPSVEVVIQDVLHTLEKFGRRTGSAKEKTKWLNSVWRPLRMRMKIADCFNSFAANHNRYLGDFLKNLVRPRSRIKYI